jgi:hypothetical protein
MLQTQIIMRWVCLSMSEAFKPSFNFIFLPQQVGIYSTPRVKRPFLKRVWGMWLCDSARIKAQSGLVKKIITVVLPRKGISFPVENEKIFQQPIKLNRHQRWLVEQLKKPGDLIEMPKKMLSINDMIKLSAHECVEFALFTRWSQRILMRGDVTYVPFTPGMAKKWAKRGWRWSGHTHPHGGNIPLTPSSGIGKSHDAAVLWRFSQYGTQRYSVVYDWDGNWRVFRPNENPLFQPGWGPHQ